MSKICQFSNRARNAKRSRDSGQGTRRAPTHNLLAMYADPSLLAGPTLKVKPDHPIFSHQILVLNENGTNIHHPNSFQGKKKSIKRSIRSPTGVLQTAGSQPTWGQAWTKFTLGHFPHLRLHLGTRVSKLFNEGSKRLNRARDHPRRDGMCPEDTEGQLGGLAKKGRAGIQEGKLSQGRNGSSR